MSVGVTCAAGQADKIDGDSRSGKSPICGTWCQGKHVGGGKGM